MNVEFAVYQRYSYNFYKLSASAVLCAELGVFLGRSEALSASSSPPLTVVWVVNGFSHAHCLLGIFAPVM